MYLHLRDAKAQLAATAAESDEWRAVKTLMLGPLFVWFVERREKVGGCSDWVRFLTLLFRRLPGCGRSSGVWEKGVLLVIIVSWEEF